jgi:molybdate transport system substrate-binding protein
MAFPILALAGCAAALFTAPAAHAGTTNVAVAANFSDAAKEIAAAFKARTGHNAVLSFGSSGALFAQIGQAAPFHVFLSADEERPKKLAGEGLGVPETRFTYAIGKLVLWSKDPGYVRGEETLRANLFSKISIANPAAAPYGSAAIETLRSLRIHDAVQPKIVMGTSLAQAFQFVDTRNAELGFVALAQVMGNAGGSRWLVPQNLYTEIRQDAILLKTGANNEAARAFISFLKAPDAQTIIEKFGYALALK